MERQTETERGVVTSRELALPIAERLLRAARRHPLAAILIGLGFGWLLVERRRPSAPSDAVSYDRGLRVQPVSLPPGVKTVPGDVRLPLYPPDPAADLPETETAALRRGGFEMKPPGPEEPGALAQTAAELAALLESSFTADETARRVGVEPGRVRQLLADRHLYALYCEGDWRIPAFQLENDHLVPGLAEVVPALPEGLHPLAVYRWFVTPNPDLAPEESDKELSPREWLLTGHDPRIVAELAADLDLL